MACGALLSEAVIAHFNYRVRLLDKQTLKIKCITSRAAEEPTTVFRGANVKAFIDWL